MSQPSTHSTQPWRAPYFWLRSAGMAAFLFCISTGAISQIDNRYYEWVKVADSLYKNKQYDSAATYYSNAFAVNNSKGYVVDRYSAACAWMYVANFDSAFYNLNRIVTYTDYFNYVDISTDPNLLLLHADSRWQQLIETIHKNGSQASPKKSDLARELNRILADDQKGRGSIEAIQKKFGSQSRELKDLWVVIKRSDSANLIAVEKILDEYGWVGPDEVGDQGNIALFLVIQHADLATQQKYLPMLRAAVKNNKARGENLALMEDRVAIGEGKMQIYGSQIGIDSKTGAYYVLPIGDPDNVDKRRISVGLNTMAEYLSQWKIKWDVEEYKRTSHHP